MKAPVAALSAVATLSLATMAGGCGDAGPSAVESAPSTTVRNAAGTIGRNQVIVRNSLPDEVLLTVDKVDDSDWEAGDNPSEAAPNGFQDVRIAPGGRYTADLAVWYTDPAATWELSIVQRQTNFLLARAELVAWWREANSRGGVSLNGFIPKGAPFTTGPHAFPAIPGIDEKVTVRIGISTTSITITPPQ